MIPVTIEVPLWVAAVVVCCLLVALVCGTVGQRIAVMAATGGALLQLPLLVMIGFLLALVSTPRDGDA